MTQPFALPAPGSRRWIDDPDRPQRTPARKPPRRTITLLPRSEELPCPPACPPTARGGTAPRASVPTASPSDLVRSSAGITRHIETAPAEGEAGVPGAGPGARAAEPSAAESPARRRARASRGAPSSAALVGSSPSNRSASSTSKGSPNGGRPPQILLSHEGRELSITEWAEELGISRHTIKTRLRGGWTVEEALSTAPLRGRPSRANAWSLRAKKAQTVDGSAPVSDASSATNRVRSLGTSRYASVD